MRPSPAYPAKKYPNESHRGGDDKWWQSVPNKNGVFRWRRAKSNVKGQATRPKASQVVSVSAQAYLLKSNKQRVRVEEVVPKGVLPKRLQRIHKLGTELIKEFAEFEECIDYVTVFWSKTKVIIQMVFKDGTPFYEAKDAIYNFINGFQEGAEDGYLAGSITNVHKKNLALILDDFVVSKSKPITFWGKRT